MSPWFMPAMFLLAGVSACFSLKKRTGSDFLKERFRRLGIPFLFGVIFVNPILSYVADKTHNGYKGTDLYRKNVFRLYEWDVRLLLGIVIYLLHCSFSCCCIVSVFYFVNRYWMYM